MRRLQPGTKRRNPLSLFYFPPLNFKTLVHYGCSDRAFLSRNGVLVLRMSCTIVSTNNVTSMSITVLLPFRSNPIRASHCVVRPPTAFSCSRALWTAFGGASKCGVILVRYPYSFGDDIVGRTDGRKDDGSPEYVLYAFSTARRLNCSCVSYGNICVSSGGENTSDYGAHREE